MIGQLLVFREPLRLEGKTVGVCFLVVDNRPEAQVGRDSENYRSLRDSGYVQDLLILQHMHMDRRETKEIASGQPESHNAGPA